MSAFRMIQISDLHISRERTWFQFNWEHVLEAVNKAAPDLVVCTGDVALNAVSSPDDLTYAREQLERLNAPWLLIPGNHDIGNNRPCPRGRHEVSSSRIAAWRDVYGLDFWSHDIGDWRFIGLNAQSIGSGLREEEEQLDFLRDVLKATRDKPIALFLHKPLFLLDPDEDRKTQGSLFPEVRERFMEEIANADIRLVSNGHNHELVITEHDGLKLTWCPATSFVALRGASAMGNGDREPGYLDYHFDGDSLDVTPILPDELMRIDIATWLMGPDGLYERFTSGAWEPPKDVSAAAE